MSREARPIAIACCRRSADAGARDLYPDPDAVPLQAALRRTGASANLVAWDDPAVVWEDFARVVISSTWDSVDRPAQYLGWARHVADVTILVNDFAFIEWDLDKVHQKELGAAGVPVLPTTWVAPGEDWGPPTRAEFVVKPSVSAGGRSTARYAPGDEAALGHVRGLQAAGQTVMVQDYLATIDTNGETDLIFFDGSFSHAVKKKPLLIAGQGVTERPWEHMAWAGRAVPDCLELGVAEATLGVIRARMGAWPAYARVDLVNGPAGSPLVLEVEMIDPLLSLGADPGAAGRLASAVLRSLA